MQKPMLFKCHINTTLSYVSNIQAVKSPNHSAMVILAGADLASFPVRLCLTIIKRWTGNEARVDPALTKGGCWDFISVTIAHKAWLLRDFRPSEIIKFSDAVLGQSRKII